MMVTRYAVRQEITGHTSLRNVAATENVTLASSLVLTMFPARAGDIAANFWGGAVTGECHRSLSAAFVPNVDGMQRRWEWAKTRKEATGPGLWEQSGAMEDYERNSSSGTLVWMSIGGKEGDVSAWDARGCWRWRGLTGYGEPAEIWVKEWDRKRIRVTRR